MTTYIHKTRVITVVLAAVLGAMAIPQTLLAAAGGPHAAFLGGPWELMVQAGLEGKGLHFPLEVLDETKPQKLNSVLPLMGTPIKIKLDQYVPDLRWQTRPVPTPNGGTVAKIVVEGTNLKQDIWLCSDDPMRRSVTSSIGSVTIHYVGDANAATKLFEQIERPGVVGILTVQGDQADDRADFVVKPGQVVSLPKPQQKVEILKYIPHYSIDTKTMEVTNRSDKPVNPAIRVRFTDGRQAHETWLWSKFQSSPHSKTDLPVSLKFTDIDLSESTGNYILLAVRGTDSGLLTYRDGHVKLTKAELNKPYPFSQADYTFRIEQIVHDAAVVKDWRNNSDRLINPAFVVTIEQGDSTEQAVLELNKPHHYKTDDGTYAIVFGRAPKPAGHGSVPDEKEN